MKISRCWSMPNKWTFTIKPIAELVARYVGDGKGWIDPFAGKNSPAEITNDLDPTIPSQTHLDALSCLRQIHGNYNGCIFDPPYSITQAKECYNWYGAGKLGISPTSMKYWASVKDEMGRLIKYNGIAICCGWSSMGLGKMRGFEMIEILLVSHGGNHYDTIVTVEEKK